jgi:hypothetical protein
VGASLGQARRLPPIEQRFPPVERPTVNTAASARRGTTRATPNHGSRACRQRRQQPSQAGQAGHGVGRVRPPPARPSRYPRRGGHHAGCACAPAGARGPGHCRDSDLLDHYWQGQPQQQAGKEARPTWQELAGDQHTRHSAAPARPGVAAPGPRPHRPRVRPAAGCPGAGPRRVPVGRAPQPPVQARLRPVALRLSDDPAHRARDGAAGSWRPQCHRGLFRGRLLVAGQLQPSLHRAGRGAAQRLSGPGGTGEGGDGVVGGQSGDQTGQESRSAGGRAAPRVAANGDLPDR